MRSFYQSIRMLKYDANKTCLESTAKMPILFLGHGSPMNAIEDNEFVSEFRLIGCKIPRPKTILCISAHWETRGTQVTSMAHPKTIHDFSGFPKALYEVQYQAPGDPLLAEQIQTSVIGTSVKLDLNWGFDHGTWSVLKHLYPLADIPVVQLSLNQNLSPKEHYEVARELAFLRSNGVLIVGSGNIVHNLRHIDWNRSNEIGYGFDWALEANEKIENFIIKGNHDALINYSSHGDAMNLAIPTTEHFLPLIYILGISNQEDTLSFFNQKLVGGSLSMTSLIFNSNN